MCQPVQYFFMFCDKSNSQVRPPEKLPIDAVWEFGAGRVIHLWF